MTAGMHTNVVAVATIIDFKNKKAACTSNLEVQAAFLNECGNDAYRAGIPSTSIIQTSDCEPKRNGTPQKP